MTTIYEALARGRRKNERALYDMRLCAWRLYATHTDMIQCYKFYSTLWKICLFICWLRHNMVYCLQNTPLETNFLTIEEERESVGVLKCVALQNLFPMHTEHTRTQTQTHLFVLHFWTWCNHLNYLQHLFILTHSLTHAPILVWLFIYSFVCFVQFWILLCFACVCLLAMDGIFWGWHVMYLVYVGKVSDLWANFFIFLLLCCIYSSPICQTNCFDAQIPSSTRTLSQG